MLTAATGEEGQAQAAVGAPDVVVLDLGLPDLDGVEVCRRLRRERGTGHRAVGQRRRGPRVATLDGGVDDYMTKPFGMGELEARLRVALRHARGDDAVKEPRHMTVGHLELDLVHHEARMAGGPGAHDAGVRAARLPGTPRREDLHAPPHPGARVGAALRSETQYLRVYAYRLRKKLGDEQGAFLRTHPGVGYQLVEPPA